MKRLLRAAFAASLFLPALALAHPGHDEPHDFEWDFDHLAAHPLATILCLALVAVSAWVVWQFLRERRSWQSRQRERIRR